MTDLGNQSIKKNYHLKKWQGGWTKAPTAAPPPVRSLMNPGNFCWWNMESRVILMWNPKSWPLGLGTQLKESRIPLTIGNHNPSSTAKNGVQYLESGTHGVESRILDCLGFPSMGRITQKFPQQSLPPRIRSPNSPHCIQVETWSNLQQK